MATTWATIATTWTTETAQWNAFPVEYLYSGGMLGIFGATNATLVQYSAPTGTMVGVFGAASSVTQNNEALYLGTVVGILGIEMGDFDLLTWTPRSAATNSWIEETAL